MNEVIKSIEKKQLKEKTVKKKRQHQLMNTSILKQKLNLVKQKKLIRL